MAWLNLVVIGLIFLLVAVIIRVRQQRQPHSNKLDLHTRKMGSSDGYHRLAAHYTGRGRPAHTSRGSALLDEAYLRLVSQEKTEWQDRARFFGIAARLMREILVDHARARQAGGHGGLVEKLPVGEARDFSPAKSRELVELDDALRDLERQDPQQGRIVELRYFGGLTVEETAEVLGISPRTVKRDWSVARAWLHGEVSGRRDALIPDQCGQFK
jgi:RNA polymerase sigma factor (TIGR02999 family)